MSRRGKATTALAAAAATMLLATSCGQPADGGGGGNGDDEQQDWLSSVSVVTGGTAGVFYSLGGTLSGVLESNVDDLSVSVESTGASVENLRLVDSGSADLAITQGDSAGQAYEGIVDFDGEPVEVSTLAVLYPNVYHTVTLEGIQSNLGLECISDLEGTRFSVGDIGSGNETSTNQMFESLGMDVEEDINRSQLGYAETADALSSGGLDAGSWMVGEGHAGINELAATEDIAIVPVCDDELEAILDGPGGYTEHIVEGGTYPGVDEDIQTFAVWNVLVVPADFNEEQAYEITAAMYENVEELSGAYEQLTEYLTHENILNSPTPIHPGAVQYFEENGVDIPDELIG